jgi:hypothetical protein
MECFLNALTEALPPEQRQVVSAFYASESAAFRAALMRSTAPEATVDTFERDVERATPPARRPAARGGAARRRAVRSRVRRLRARPHRRQPMQVRFFPVRLAS